MPATDTTDAVRCARFRLLATAEPYRSSRFGCHQLGLAANLAPEAGLEPAYHAGVGYNALTVRPHTNLSTPELLRTLAPRRENPHKTSSAINCFVGPARFERARLWEPDLQSSGFNHSPTDPQNNRISLVTSSIALWVRLDSNERVFGNRIYSPAASTTHPRTHKTIEFYRRTSLSIALWTRQDSNLYRLILVREIYSLLSSNQCSARPQSNRIIR